MTITRKARHNELVPGKPQRRYFDRRAGSLILKFESYDRISGDLPFLPTSFSMPVLPVTSVLIGRGLIEGYRITHELRSISGVEEVKKNLRSIQREYEKKGFHVSAENIQRFCFGDGDVSEAGYPLPRLTIDAEIGEMHVQRACCLIVVKKHEQRASYEIIRLGEEGKLTEFWDKSGRGVWIGPDIKLSIEPRSGIYAGSRTSESNPGIRDFPYEYRYRPKHLAK